MDRPVVSEVLTASPVTPVDEAALATYGCDVALVSDESTPANLLFAEALECVPDPALGPVLSSAYERIRVIYDHGEAGGMVSHPSRLRAIVRTAAEAHDIDPAALSLLPLLPFFERINRVLFQHQTLAWLADGNGLQLRIYGSGWERHPQFGEFARGPIPSAQARHAVWLASRINLAASPFGAANDDVLLGIASGAFYLMRFCPADVIERFYAPVAAFCRENQITTTAELRKRAPRSMRRLVGFASRTLGMDVLGEWDEFVPHLLDATATSRVRSAAAIWPETYPAVSFASRDELLAQCTRHLYDVPARKRLAEAMRRQLAEASARVSVTVDRELLARLTGQEVAA
jgi:hypothetical protein